MSRTLSHVVVGCVRALAVATAAAVVVHEQAANRRIAQLWEWLLTSPIFRHDTFEPALATLCLVVWIWLWGAIDIAATVVLPPLRRFRLRSHDANLSMWLDGDRLRSNLVWYLAPIAVFDWFVPRRAEHLAACAAAPSVRRVAAEVVLALLVYDALFFAWHMACHQWRWLWKHVHKEHHRYATTRACETVRLSFVEQVLDVSFSIIALNALQCHPLSRAIYNIVITYLLVELHCGYDMPWMLRNVVPLGLVAGAVEHNQHHVVGTGNFEKFFTHLDRTFGTVVT